MSELDTLLVFGRGLPSRVDCSLLVILALPVFLVFTGADWVFYYIVGPAYIDPWVYLGFFLNLSTHLHIFPTSYYGSRLSWILPGYTVYRLFSPLVAAYVLHFALYYAAVSSLYLILKDTVGQRVALLSAILMGCYSHFLHAVAWDYVDGAGITYFILTTLALTYAARRYHYWMWLVASGAFCGAMIYSQLFTVVFTAPLLFYYFFSNKYQGRHSIWLGLLFFASGLLGITVLLGAVNYKLGSRFLFYLPSLQVATQLAKSNPWKVSLSLWVNRATWLIVPCLTMFGSLTFLLLNWKRRSDRKTRFLILFQSYFLLSALILLLFELEGSPVLQLSYYASLLIPTMFLAIGAQLAPVTERLSSRHFVLLVCGTITILRCAYLFPASSRLSRWLSSHALSLLLALVLTGLTLFFLRGGPAKALALCLTYLALGMVIISNSIYRAKDPPLQRHAFRAIVQSVRVIQTFYSDGKPLFWYSADESIGHLYRSVSSTYLWGFTLINERFPALEKGDGGFQYLKPDVKLAIISNHEDALQKADESLRRVGFWAQFIAERTIQDGPISWKITFITVRNWPIIEDFRLTADGWPESVALRWESQDRLLVSFSGRETHELFRSDMTTTTDWEVDRYGRSGGLSIQPSCLAAGDNCGIYSSGDQRDHLASPFVALPPTKPVSILFSIWVKPLKDKAIPNVFLQDERFFAVAQGRELSTRGDGWVLLGNWLEVRDPQKLRLVVMQSPGTASLLDKALLVEFPTQIPTLRAVARKKNRGPKVSH